MDQRHSHRVKLARASVRSIAGTSARLCLIWLSIAPAVNAKANLPQLILAPEGAISAWTLSGPCSSLEAMSTPASDANCDSNERLAVVSATGDVDWGEILKLPPNGTAAARASADLQVGGTFEGWLLVGADGRLRVKVDGRLVHRRDRPFRRGHAFVPIELSLGPGMHSLVIELERSNNRSSFSILLRDKRTNQSPLSARLRIPPSLSAGLLVQRLTRYSIRPLSLSNPLELTLELRFPSAALNADLPVSLELRSGTPGSTRHWSAGVLRAVDALRGPYVIHLGPMDRLISPHESRLTIGIGASVFEQTLWLSPELFATFQRAARALELPLVREATQSHYDAIGATLQAHVERVSERMTEPSRSAFEDALRRLNALLQDLELGNNPFAHSGYVDAFIRSAYDKRPTSVMAYIPDGYVSKPLQPVPLVVALHGYDGGPRNILDAFLGLENDTKHAREIDGIVLAPAAYGNSFYRGPGESAVLDALDWAMETYRIDSARVYITGVSMGGTGAAEIGLKHSQRFAAAAPLCGYQSYFVRRDTSNRPLRSWEQRLMHRFSPASFAENGNDLPMFVAQGLKDQPLENSKVLTKRYKALGNTLVEDWPNLGHSVWKKSYRDATMYSWLTQWKKDLEPKRVIVGSSSLRHGKKFWLEIERLGGTTLPGLLEGLIVTPNRIVLRTRGVTAFRVGRSRHIDDVGTLQFEIDGQAVLVQAGMDRRFEHVSGTWRLKSDQQGDEPPAIAVEGPWSELFSEPLAVVYGTLVPDTAALNREIASRLVEPRRGVDLRIPIYADRDFDAESSQLTRLIYVGTSKDHSILAKIMDRLPVQNGELGIRLGTRTFPEPDVGAAFVYPDPDRGDRLLGVVTANSPEGMWRVLALPALVPDFVVFDRGIDAAAGESVLGAHARVRAAGFFRDDWSLPEDVSDPLAIEPR